MASRDPPFHCNRPEKSKTNLNPAQKEGNVKSEEVLQTMKKKKKRTSLLPRPVPSVQRIMRRVIPRDAKITNEGKEFLAECTADVINFITSEANHHCKKEQRKTVTAEDLIHTLRNLGFDHHADALASYLQRYRDNNARNAQQPPALSKPVGTSSSGVFPIYLSPPVGLMDEDELFGDSDDDDDSSDASVSP